MPTEFRQIEFQKTEFFSAVRDYRARRGEPLPLGSVLGIDFGEQPDIKAKIRISSDEGDDVTEIELAPEIIAAALILFCINRKIPLPAHAQKSIKRLGANIGLVINIDMANYNARRFSDKVPDLPYLRGGRPSEKPTLN